MAWLFQNGYSKGVIKSYARQACRFHKQQVLCSGEAVRVLLPTSVVCGEAFSVAWWWWGHYLPANDSVAFAVPID